MLQFSQSETATSCNFVKTQAPIQTSEYPKQVFLLEALNCFWKTISLAEFIKFTSSKVTCLYEDKNFDNQVHIHEYEYNASKDSWIMSRMNFI